MQPSVPLSPAAAYRQPSLFPFVLVVLAISASVLAHDWIAGAALLLLWAGWHYLGTAGGSPVLALAFTFQWTQVVAGVLYYAVTGRQVPAMYETDYRPMVLIGLGSIAALLLGLVAGTRLLRAADEPDDTAVFRWPALVRLYLASIVLAGALRRLAWWIPQLTQPIIMLSFFRFGLLFLILRRLVAPRPRWGWVCAVLGGEVLLGFTGYFAEFREALAIGALALFAGFDRRRVRHWFGLGLFAGLAFMSGVIWMSIRSDYRAAQTSGVLSASRLERLQHVQELVTQWLATDLATMWVDVDALVHRTWAVYYPALAVRRVPAVLPHTDGLIFGKAIRHVLSPRLLFPDKGTPPSDSQSVRRYSGVWVAGPEQETTIAFGYAAESYVDFGVPWMFVPIFGFGLLMGIVYRSFLRVIRHRELAVALVSVMFWMSLFQFERSWLKTLGLSGTMIIYLGGATTALDRYLAGRRRGQRVMRRAGARQGQHA
jgi:hypothetical protein